MWSQEGGGDVEAMWSVFYRFEGDPRSMSVCRGALSPFELWRDIVMWYHS